MDKYKAIRDVIYDSDIPPNINTTFINLITGCISKLAIKTNKFNIKEFDDFVILYKNNKYYVFYHMQDSCVLKLVKSNSNITVSCIKKILSYIEKTKKCLSIQIPLNHQLNLKLLKNNLMLLLYDNTAIDNIFSFSPIYNEIEYNRFITYKLYNNITVRITKTRIDLIESSHLFRSFYFDLYVRGFTKNDYYIEEEKTKNYIEESVLIYQECFFYQGLWIFNRIPFFFKGNEKEELKKLFFEKLDQEGIRIILIGEAYYATIRGLLKEYPHKLNYKYVENFDFVYKNQQAIEITRKEK